MIAIIDSGMANLGSVLGACRRIGAAAAVTENPADIAGASALILPGVGAFADAMQSLRRRNLLQPIQDAAAQGVPILGICLGMQLLAQTGEEFGTHPGLGLIAGRVVRLEPVRAAERVPNIGWCDVEALPRSRLFQDIPQNSAFYFMHSYHFLCAHEEDRAGTIAYGETGVCAALEHGPIFGVQFHPEKSQDLGLRVLDNFVRLARNIS